MDSAFKLPFADLHVHSTYSDSALTPCEIVRQAVENRVGLLAIADHEGFQGSIEAEPLCREAGVGFLSAAELSCLYLNKVYHVLCYGADVWNTNLRALAARGRAALDGMSDELLQKMLPDYPRLSAKDYAAYEHDLTLGGWRVLGYLMTRGVTKALREGMPLYKKYGVTYEDADFPSLSETVSVIHLAGGRAVLAHPGIMIPSSDEAAFTKKLNELLSQGLDGVECYYPTHPEAVTRLSLAVCRARDLIVTGGSDCHGSFGHSRVGEMDLPIEKLRLKDLRPKH